MGQVLAQTAVAILHLDNGFGPMPDNGVPSADFAHTQDAERRCDPTKDVQPG
jgi:hypothetical protein